MSFNTNIHIQWFASGETGNLLGGERTNVPSVIEITSRLLHNVYPEFTKEDTETGITKYRCLYMRNMHPKIPLKNPILYIPVNTTSNATEIWAGIDPAGVGDGISTGVATTIINENTAPSGVFFTQATNRKEGIPLRVNLPPNGQCVAVWFRVKLNPTNESKEADYTRISFGCDNKVDDTGIPADPIDTTIGVIGETDQNENSSEIIKRYHLRNLAWLIFNGNITTSGSPSWMFNILSWLKDFTLFSWGNEDVKHISIRNQIGNAFSFSSPNVANGFNSHNINNVHCLMIDTSGFQSYENPSSQYDFVVEDLDNASRDADIDFICVSMHDTMYGALPANETSYTHNDVLRRTYHKLFQDYGVHVVFQTKIRNYQRLGVLRYNEANTDQPSTLLSGPNYSITGGVKSFGADSGVLFVNVGTGGRTPFHTIGSTTNYPQIITSVPTIGGIFELEAKMRREGQPAKLIGRYYDYVKAKPTLLSFLFGTSREEKLVDSWSISVE